MKRNKMKEQAQPSAFQTNLSEFDPSNTGILIYEYFLDRSNISADPGNDFTAYSTVRANKIGLRKQGGGDIEDIQTPSKKFDGYTTIN